MQLSGTSTIKLEVCDAYFRLLHQDDVAMLTCKEVAVWRHFLESAFAVSTP